MLVHGNSPYSPVKSCMEERKRSLLWSQKLLWGGLDLQMRQEQWPGFLELEEQAGAGKG